MFKPKRLISALSAAVLALGLLAGCGQSPSGSRPDAVPQEDTIQVVATIFPLYDWARQVIGEVPGVELTWLQDTGVDMHSYQPTAQDMLRVSSCDLFLYIGGTSDSWVEDALAEAVNPAMQTVSMLEQLGSQAGWRSWPKGCRPRITRATAMTRRPNTTSTSGSPSATPSCWSAPLPTPWAS